MRPIGCIKRHSLGRVGKRRPIARLFAGSDRGGERAAAIYTLIGTAELNGLDPQAWLAGRRARLPQPPRGRPMSSKYINTTLASGYTLSGVYGSVTIGPEGSIGGAGLVGGAADAYTILNLGSIVASDTGADGIALAAGGAVTNGSSGRDRTLIAGAHGRTGRDGTKADPNGGAAGAGGAGISLAADGSVSNFGRVRGGDGGRGGNGYNGGLGGSGDAAGSGGAGISLAGGNVINLGVVQGGAGGEGGSGYGFNGNGLGGGGGAGIVLSAAGTVANHGTVIGGAGGVSGGIFVTGRPPIGLGGAGIDLADGGVVVNFGSVAAGGYYNSGILLAAPGRLDNRGVVTGGEGGGAGVDLARGGDVLNSGAIVGGVGVTTYGAIAVPPLPAGPAIILAGAGKIRNTGMITGGGAKGGLGIVLAGYGDLVVNLGTIAGGAGGGNGGNAIEFEESGEVRNSGAIAGGAAGNYDSVGGTAIMLSRGGEVLNSGAITGGVGSPFSHSPIFSTYMGPGAGGTAIALSQGSVVNTGTITGGAGGTGKTRGGAGGTAIVVYGGGEVTNRGTIAGGAGGTGKAPGVGGVGIDLVAGGIVRNGAGGLISGAGQAIFEGALPTTASVVTNFGTILAAHGTGIALYNGNNTVTNAGLITGADGTAIAFHGGSNRLVVDQNAVFHGVVLAVGGGGTDEIDFNKNGRIELAPEYIGFSIVRLGGGGPTELIVTQADFHGLSGGTALTVEAGKGADTIDAGSLVSGNTLAIYAGGDTTMTGGKNMNEFVFERPGHNTIEDFAASGSNRLVFSNAGFDLGLAGATATPERMTWAEAATLFVDGKFTDTSQRLAYDRATGQLFFGSEGSGGTKELVATLADHAAIDARQLFFIT
jgi:autotransporter family porin